MAYDEGGHFSPSLMLHRFNQTVYWPTIGANTCDYYVGCLKCAKFGPGKTQGSVPADNCAYAILHYIIVANFVGPFSASLKGNRYFFLMVNYFSRYAWAEATPDTLTSVTKKVIKGWRYRVGTILLYFYLDPGSSFISHELKAFMQRIGLEIINCPSGLHKSVRMVEIHCKISQNVLPKLTAPLAKPAKNAGTLNKEWDLALPKALAIMISRYMTKVGYSPFKILYRTLHMGVLELTYPNHETLPLKSALAEGTFELLTEDKLGEFRLEHALRI